MFAKLGYGKGDTILACLGIILGCPAYVLLAILYPFTETLYDFLYELFSPFLLWKYGRRIRMSSKYAHKSQRHTQGKVDVEES